MLENQILNNDYVFVYGANLAGIHGRGAAWAAAKYYGARRGQFGFSCNSYGIPTKDVNLHTLPLSTINNYVCDFLEFAIVNPRKQFFVTRIGCGLAGYLDEDIAPMFDIKLPNVIISNKWSRINNHTNTQCVLVAGSRSIVDQSLIYDSISKFTLRLFDSPFRVVHGGAVGVDKMGGHWAIDHGIPCTVFPANWAKFGRSAGHLRNELMGNFVDCAVVIWDGQSRGTKDMISILKRDKTPHVVVQP